MLAAIRKDGVGKGDLGRRGVQRNGWGMLTATPYKPALLTLTQPKEWPASCRFPRGGVGGAEGQEHAQDHSVKGD